MRIELFSNLEAFFRDYQKNTTAAELQQLFLGIVKDLSDFTDLCGRTGPLQSVYEAAVAMVEREAADKGFDEDLLALQRNLYRELENLLNSENIHKRHHFLVVIPVADRPVMLKSCLESLSEQCRLFGYGGTVQDAEGRRIYQKITTFIIDDSKEEENIQTTKELCSEAISSGLRTFYVGLQEQTEILRQIRAGLREEVRSILGNTGAAQPRKGASISRNLAYLHLHAFLKLSGEKSLIYFLDSDEEFRVKVKDSNGIEDLPFINYFYWFDRLFSKGEVEIVTGKVVGDPPVSPSVMIGTFLEDMSLFLEGLCGATPDSRCMFHDQEPSRIMSAEYHDMAGLFGYNGLSQPLKYLCSLSGPHTVRDCFEDFSKKALGFFSGLHPTRTQYYSHQADFIKTTPARTVYTGNYLFTPGCLRHFIPFANLKLRMAGPSLGRILKRRLGQRFVSANLPLLHIRTNPKTYRNEFRAGVSSANDSIDVSLELNRQFWGDVMLFTIEQIAELGFPDKKIVISEIAAVASRIQAKLWNLYEGRQTTTAERIANIETCLTREEFWWNCIQGAETAADNIRLFCSLAKDNFGMNSSGMKIIAGQIEEGLYLKEIIHAIASFYEADIAWNKLLKSELVSPL